MLPVSEAFLSFQSGLGALAITCVISAHFFTAASTANTVVGGWCSLLDGELHEVKDEPTPTSQCLEHTHTLRKPNGKTMMETMLWRLPYPLPAVTTKPYDVLVASLPFLPVPTILSALAQPTLSPPCD